MENKYAYYATYDTTYHTDYALTLRIIRRIIRSGAEDAEAREDAARDRDEQRAKEARGSQRHELHVDAVDQAVCGLTLHHALARLRLLPGPS
eukprot:4899284-Pyramimonas_sp.AAC.2